MKVIIAGTRTFKNYELLKKHVDAILANQKDVEIVSGGAMGTDRLGEKYALSHTLMIKRFVADWNKYGKAAGPIRNKQMAEYADALIAFWDGKSKGTESMISLAKEHNLKIRIIKIDE